jgi:pilus assembly protein Flp/PilA
MRPAPGMRGRAGDRKIVRNTTTFVVAPQYRQERRQRVRRTPMRAVVRNCRRLLRDGAEKGASAVEYGLMVAAIAAVIVGTVFALGGFVKGAFDTTCKSLTVPMGGSCVSK